MNEQDRKLVEENPVELFRDCCKVIAHLSGKVQKTYTTFGGMRSATPEECEALLEFGALDIMQLLGDFLSEMDAYTDDDEWTDEIFARANAWKKSRKQ